ncbi:MAG: hypothetical protein K8T91_25635 [Planctomycetes bacterium]|nr:hypothetical protein [Planctomycetota bacterium]
MSIATHGDALAAILARLENVKQNGAGYSARCPRHDDRRASLSVARGDNGGVVLFCHADENCTAEVITGAIGFTPADLMPPRDSRHVGNGKPHASGQRKPATIYRTAAEAVAAIERQHGPRSTIWTYHNASGEPVGVVVRWDRGDGVKDIRPVSRIGTGWQVAAMPEPRPLYRLPDLLADPGQRVFVAEGEKAADAAASLGLIATTSAGGAKAASKTDWRPLAGRDVVFIPDNDKPGMAYANEVAAILATLNR